LAFGQGLQVQIYYFTFSGHSGSIWNHAAEEKSGEKSGDHLLCVFSNSLTKNQRIIELFIIGRYY